MTRRGFLATAGAAAGAAAQRAPRCAMGFTPDSFAILRPPRTALELLETAHAAGAGGVQATLASLEPEYLKQVRRKADELGMYFEVLAALPGADTTQFEKTVQAAKEAGAECMRTVCLVGRRYETFDSLEKWKEFVAESRQKMERARAVAERHRFPIGIENHKDWTAEEFAALLKQYGGEYLGACIDFGNNVSLLDDAMELVETLAPYVINTHIKDMAVEEYEEGFLMSEVALGKGYLDLKRMVATLQRVRPKVRFSLDMLTRDPLKIPCLTEKYWVTFPERNGKYLARALATVRKKKWPGPLPRVTGLEREAALRMERENLEQSVAYARDELGLRV